MINYNALLLLIDKGISYEVEISTLKFTKMWITIGKELTSSNSFNCNICFLTIKQCIKFYHSNID